MRIEQGLCKSHPDFHMPADVEIGVGFDADAYVRRLRDCGADAVVCFAKCHYGHSYYYTDVGCRHPRLACDMLRETCEAGRRRGVAVVAYYSVFLDTAAVLAHPEWAVQSTKQGEAGGFDSGNFLPVCVNSPYVDELLMPQSLEVIGGYDVAGLFFDTMTGFHPCHCPHCRRLFGRDIPESAGDPAWPEYVRWYAECFDGFFARTVQALHDAEPEVPVTFNWKWGIREPTPPPPHVGWLAADLVPTGTQASLQCRYFAGTGLPFDYMTGRFLHGLGDWNSNTPESLRYTAAATVANGGSFWLIDRQLPDGSLEERAWQAMRDTFGFVQARRDYVLGMRHVPEVGVLYAYATVVGEGLEHFPDAGARKERMKPFEGAVRLFVEHGRHFTGLSAEAFEERGGEYRAVVVPEQDVLPGSTRRWLGEYVEGGGRLLVSQSDWRPAEDPDLMELAGGRYEGHADLPYGYFGEEEPIAVRGRFALVSPGEDAEGLCPYLPPLGAGEGGRKFGHGFAPPALADGHAAVVRRSVGAGEVIYIAAPVFRAYLDHQNPHLARLLLGLVDRLLPDPVVRVSTRAQVEVVAGRKGENLVVHLVNHSGRERLGGHWYPVTEYIPEVRDVRVAVRDAAHVGEALLVPEGEGLSCARDGDYAEFTVPRLHVMASLLVPGYFAGEDL
jgi:hypothetical protein